MIAAGGSEKFRFRVRRDNEIFVQKYLPYTLGKRSTARFAGERRVYALSVKIFREQSELSGLAHSLATL